MLPHKNVVSFRTLWTHAASTHAAHSYKEIMSDAPTLGKRRSSKRIAAMDTEAAAAPSLLKRKSSTGLTGAMSGLETGARIG